MRTHAYRYGYYYNYERAESGSFSGTAAPRGPRTISAVLLVVSPPGRRRILLIFAFPARSENAHIIITRVRVHGSDVYYVFRVIYFVIGPSPRVRGAPRTHAYLLRRALHNRTPTRV